MVKSSQQKQEDRRLFVGQRDLKLKSAKEEGGG